MWLEGVGGTVEGSFFKTPPFVDLNKPPGSTSLATEVPTTSSFLWSYLSASYFFYSPNLTWCLIAAGVYVVFPYGPLENWRGETLAGLAVKRLCINFFVTIGYTGFWHVVLYSLGWCSRPFSSCRAIGNVSAVVHNVFYTCLGVVQWTAFETAFLWCYATQSSSLHIFLVCGFRLRLFLPVLL
jgi:hypothetical protein